MNWNSALQAGLIVWTWYATYLFLKGCREVWIDLRRKKWERLCKMTELSTPHEEFRSVFASFVDYTGVSEVEIDRKDGKVTVKVNLKWWGCNRWYKRLVSKQIRKSLEESGFDIS